MTSRIGDARDTLQLSLWGWAPIYHRCDASWMQPRRQSAPSLELRSSSFVDETIPNKYSYCKG